MRKSTSIPLLAAALSLICAGQSWCGLVINEVKWRGEFEWIELYNYSDEEFDLGTVRLHSTHPDANRALLLDVTWDRGTTIPPYGYYLICDENPAGRIKAIYTLADRKVPMTIHDDIYVDLELRDRGSNRVTDYAVSRHYARFDGDVVYTPLERLDPGRTGGDIRNWQYSAAGPWFRVGRDDSGHIGTPRARNSHTPYFFSVQDGGLPFFQRIDEMHYEGIFPEGTNGVALQLDARNSAETEITLVNPGTWPFGGPLIINNDPQQPRIIGILATERANTRNGPHTDERVVRVEAQTGRGKWPAPAFRHYRFETQQNHGCGIVSGGAAPCGNVLLIGILILSIGCVRIAARRATGGARRAKT